MLPAHLAENIRRQVLYYIESTFDFRDRQVEQAFETFLEDPEKGIFKGPWVQLRRPFRSVADTYTPPFDIGIPFRPFRHQSVAWRRLTSKDHTPQPTLVTTGTGSGKTECFLYPILDHCLRAKRSGQQGIKAIILYPMNALATDQEKRFAKAIWSDPQLKQAGIRVGTYTGRYDPGDPTSQDSGTTLMGKENGITHHGSQLEDPPDILLTNYKMLDFLLLRPQDQRLWRHNIPGILQYFVLDELHTYDGAQGADVACLIRRLKERLGIPKGQLCVVGTSATMDDRDRSDRAGGGVIAMDTVETGGDRLARFASTLFEEDIPTEAVIGEDRLTVEEIVKPTEELILLDIPSPPDCDPLLGEDATAYALRQVQLWAGPPFAESETAAHHPQALETWAVSLGEWIKGNQLFKSLLDLFQEQERTAEAISWSRLVEKLAARELAFISYPDLEDRKRILTSFFALVAHAKEIRSGRAFPLVPTQVQLWVRELTRIGRFVTETPTFGWLDEPFADSKILPPFHCSECGASGWIGMEDRSAESAIQAKGIRGFKLTSDIKAIYRGWFGKGGSHDPRMVLIIQDPEGSIDIGDLFGAWHLHPASLVVRRGVGACPLTDDTRYFRIALNRDTEKPLGKPARGIQSCPCCGTREGIFIMGARSATLSSVMVDELFGSVLNSDPKLLAFTDSVQDASHRAGFLSSRTYNFCFRTALQGIIDAAGPAGVPLSGVGSRLLEWWSTPGVGRPGSTKEAISALLPPDLYDFQDYLDYRNNSKQATPSSSLRSAIETRLTWQATSEFGLMLLRGRTLESTGSACLAWNWDTITAAVTALHERIESVDTTLRNLPIATLCQWLLGILHRYRLRGSLGHPYLVELARYRFWGKSPFNRFIPERESHPPISRYRPHLMVTRPERDHDFIYGTTSGTTQPWHMRWTQRVLNKGSIGEAEIQDLLQLLYTVAEESHLIIPLHTDGGKCFYAINPDETFLTTGGIQLVCSETGRQIVRPSQESEIWIGAPSLEYSAQRGKYQSRDYTKRQVYYQDRYRKGALRRVVAQEHTGMLATEERETLERTFALAEHKDDPNVLTCTSTLEMGIDIGDLSSTMLCSIPPTTASYLQRIGRAGRATGTALIISVINHQPHDLFFYARPAEMLRGKVDPPGCWVDASAVLVRQYLAYGFDCAAKTGTLLELPRTGNQFVRDMEDPGGHLPKMLAWITQHETELQQAFLARFTHVIRDDTKTRFLEETTTELLIERIRRVVNEFGRQRRDIENARKRLQAQRSKLEEHETEALIEIEDELKVLKGRANSLSRTSTLELLTNYGLLPNYAFPETGVRFYGSVYNRHRTREKPIPPIEVIRPAASALRELAPHNYFYTHRRQFKIQQIGIGSREEPLAEIWAICGQCGHMRPTHELSHEHASPACPQCGFDGGEDSQADIGQHRAFVDYSRSQAISVMEQYESLSSDRSDERERTLYQLRRSFDLTIDAPSGAVGEEGLPFGIEYRSAVILREVNVGYADEPGVVAFGPQGPAPEHGFQVCADCGVVVGQGQTIEQASHRRSCSARRRFEKAKAENRTLNPYQAESVYLYREIRSEAIRILLPPLSDDEIETLEACFLLGLRLRFEGDPSHLLIFPQRLPDAGNNLQRDYLVILDRVPGGTGYLKTLFQETDSAQRPGEGILAVMRQALNALEVCQCRRVSAREGDRDTDGCYRCIRTYAQQYSADSISRELGIRLLKRLIQAAERRIERQALTDIPNTSLFGSILEREFVRKLQDWVTEQNGTWSKNLVQGKTGFRFSLLNPNRTWELELQPQLGPVQGVSIRCQPDFLLRCADDDSIQPIAIFTDGFEFHVTTNRLADDMAKRRSILASGRYTIWTITWDDLIAADLGRPIVVPDAIAAKAETFATAARSRGIPIPSAQSATGNPWHQLLGYLKHPNIKGWKQLAEFIAAYPLEVLSAHRSHEESTFWDVLDIWRRGKEFTIPSTVENGDWVCNHKATTGDDIIAFATMADCLANRRDQVRIIARLDDSEPQRMHTDYYRPRWRVFLACLNLFQFSGAFTFFTTSEVEEGTAPSMIPTVGAAEARGEWKAVRLEVISSLRTLVDHLAEAGAPLPEVAYEDEAVSEEALAELAWPDHSPRLALLAGDQSTLTVAWQAAGWIVVTTDDLQARGAACLTDHLLG